jgi:outer membrane lipoprotein-sorting protein
MLNPMAGQTEATAMPAEMVKLSRSSFNIGGDLFNFKDKGFSDSLAGREMVDSVNAYKIKLKNADMEIVFFIDPTTYYILKSESKVSLNGQDVATTTTFSNYKKTDFGFVVPYTLGITNMGYDITITYSKIEINKDVDPKIFAMPK